ncbi:MAG: YgiQ family radical SAM protein [Prevotella sp.]|nr:YgiQ family radical SAM protein [Prevotella sp.]
MTDYQLSDWLPTTRKEMDIRGWEEADVILFSADAYVDHPSFGAAVIGRTLEAQGLRVAIVPQPDWHGDYRDFKKLGRPRLFFGIAPGCMDSMVNKYTANKRLRSEDAYSPDGRHDCRPEYPTIVYTKILKEIYPDVPVVLGGIEASMRRLTHYDYWQDRLRPSILVDSGADLLIYGMGEKPICELTRQMEEGRNISDITEIPQTAYLCDKKADMQYATDDIVLHSHEECLQNKKAQAENFRHIEEESNKIHANRIVQEVGRQVVVVNPPYPPMTTEELDRSYELPYTRLPHPKYKNKRIPAYEMIKFSVNIHRGCFGGCAFCTISAHQGKFISCRSKKSILEEVKKVSEMPGFKGYLSDLGGPSANMYGMEGKNKKACAACKRPSCINPQVCPNLNTDHSKLLEIYRAVDALPYIKKSFIGSGVRYDLLLHRSKDENVNKAAREYTSELIVNHVSGRLKVAPEHTCPAVLKLMRKPSFELFNEFKKVFEKINAEENLRQQIIPYFISSHPGCHEADMAELAVQTKKLDFHLEQVQDFTPTPMTVSTETWYTGYDPYTLEPVFSAHTPKEKLAQRMFFFWYKPEERRNIEYELKKIGRSDLISQLYGNKGFAPAYSADSRQDKTEHRTAGRRDASSRDFTGRRDGSGRDFAGRKRFSSTQEPAVKNKGKRYVPTDEAQNSRYAKDSNKGSRGRGRYKDNSSSKQRW